LWLWWALFVDEDAGGGAFADGLVDGFGQLLAGLVGDGSPQIVAKQQVEGLGQLAGHVVVVVDQQPPEEGEVELAAHAVGGFPVGAGAVGDAIEGALEVGLGLLEVSWSNHNGRTVVPMAERHALPGVTLVAVPGLRRRVRPSAPCGRPPPWRR